MIDVPAPSRQEVAAQLWRWLPGVYRARDADGRLQAFVALFADELWRLRRGIEQHYADHFIDSAQDWAVAYLADLVGTEVLYTGEAASLLGMAARNRGDVKNTLRWRRRKGTLAGLEGIARDVGGLGVHAVEMFERVAWMQNLAHIKPTAGLALDLRRGEALAAIHTPYSRARALADLRPAGQRAGWHRVGNVAVFQWPIASFPLLAATPRAIGGGHYTFHPLGLDTALHAGGATEALRVQVASRPGAPGADICHANADDVPIRNRDLREHARAYVDSPLGFAIREDGIALVGEPPAPGVSREPALDFGELAGARGMVAADPTVYGAGLRFALEAVRLGAVFTLVASVSTPVAYSPGQPLASQLQLRNPQGRLRLDSATPDFGYTDGVAPFEPDSGEFHHPALLLRVVNQGAAAADFPASEAILRNARGQAVQAYLPAIDAVAPAAAHYFYVAADGSTYHARGDHGAGAPDRNPDASLYGAFSLQHLARASEGQRRIRPGHPPERWRRVVARSLCCRDRPLVPPLAAGEVAVDAERGRFAFPAGEEPAGELSVDFRYGLTAAIGAGPHARPDLAPARITVARTRDAHHASLQAAIAAAPDGFDVPVVIEILDSAVYEEALQIGNRDFPGGLVIRAAALQTPFIVKPAAAPRALRVRDSTLAALVLDGLAFAGGALEVQGVVGSVMLRHCTLQPASASLRVVQAGHCEVALQSCISGPVHVAAAAGSCQAQDSAIQHPAASVEQPAGVDAVEFANGRVVLERCTLLGGLAAQRAKLSNTLCYGDLALADPGASCLRFSRLPRAFDAAAFRCTTATPIFVSIDWGDAGYLHLHPNSAPALLGGGEEGGEIGAFHRAGLPWRLQNTGLRLAESIPAGLTPLQVRVLPRPRFPGNPSP
ncbi:hypothetical protein [Pseudoxanthomonas suwonensis]|uniref:Uncharacterized protein n=1 Tax=Pseudoxanthomonas suwonensis TaxID=314722 RepID=A0A0E3UNA9_9GAMM|nr:hypothetical protein [Pseudoxanthomonas suwonensis]AKC86790.1 hypothetical protein WQ53_08495 [Pseudoxanthomonas suwonensis]